MLKAIIESDKSDLMKVIKFVQRFTDTLFQLKRQTQQTKKTRINRLAIQYFISIVLILIRRDMNLFSKVIHLITESCRFINFVRYDDMEQLILL